MSKESAIVLWLIWPMSQGWFYVTLGVAQIILPLFWKQIRWWCLAPIALVTLYALILLTILIVFLLASKGNPFL